ncbi:PTS transporter subunit EIIC [Clostridium sp. AL.422]|uniref:PTS sugar transporter subunit IIC n=1 Tax=Clostridium TaxID=1485 RepID=UPI00293DCC79|nr:MULTISPECIES: PTS transporter subunit EIIC [unclassified Clostridium]MDV4150363.1 PTS transporter subunit EIIC [Clostridium sp. AL.422]
MFDKFEKFMNKWLTPLAQKMDKQPHLSAIKKSMVAMTPILILGSLCLIPEAIANMLGETNIVSQFILTNIDNFYLPFYLTIGMMGFYVCLCITYFLSEHYKLYIPGAMVLGAVGFLLLVFNFTEDGGMNIRYLGTKGLFMAMISGIVAVELYRWCKKKNFTIRMPESVPDFVSRSFELIPTTVIVVGTFITVRLLSLAFFDVLPPEVLTQFLAPLVGSLDNPWMFVFITFLGCMLFFFGIHPSVLSPITAPIAAQFLAENIEAMQAGQALPHFYTGGMVSAFANFTGTGVTFGLVFWFLFSKNKAFKKVGQVSLVPALFGINEPILFGGPIVLNPTFFLPYVIGGTILGTFPAFLMKLGILARPIFNPPYVGVFLEGFLVNGHWLTIVVNALQMIGSILIWYPFFKLYEKQNIVEKKSDSKISEEDLALLGDLDF